MATLVPGEGVVSAEDSGRVGSEPERDSNEDDLDGGGQHESEAVAPAPEDDDAENDTQRGAQPEDGLRETMTLHR